MQKVDQAKEKVDLAIQKLEDIETTVSTADAEAAIRLVNIYNILKQQSQALAELSVMLGE